MTINYALSIPWDLPLFLSTSARNPRLSQVIEPKWRGYDFETPRISKWSADNNVGPWDLSTSIRHYSRSDTPVRPITRWGRLLIFRLTRNISHLRRRKIIISHARGTHHEGTTWVSMSHFKVVALHFEDSKWRATTLKVFVIYVKWRGPKGRAF